MLNIYIYVPSEFQGLYARQTALAQMVAPCCDRVMCPIVRGATWLGGASIILYMWIIYNLYVGGLCVWENVFRSFHPRRGINPQWLCLCKYIYTYSIEAFRESASRFVIANYLRNGCESTYTSSRVLYRVSMCVVCLSISIAYMCKQHVCEYIYEYYCFVAHETYMARAMW